MAFLAAAALSACGDDVEGVSTSSGSSGSTPVASTYTIGGTVSGLTGTLVLQNNAGDDLSVAADGSFTFATAVSGAYDVTILTQPALQTCTVTSGSGTASAAVTSVTVACTSDLAVSTYAGDGTSGGTDGAATSASFNRPMGITGQSDGTLLVTEYSGNRLRKIAADGTVSTLLSTGLSQPWGLAAIGSDVYVTSSAGHTIVKVASDGTSSVFAGTGSYASTDGVGTAAAFERPVGIASDSAGNLYVTDSEADAIRKIDTSGNVTTLAGGATDGFADGTGSAAQFSGPYGIVVDGSGNLFVADISNQRIRKITPAGVVTTYAGTGTAGATDGDVSVATFNRPITLTLGSDGSLYVGEESNHKVRKISADGTTVTTVAGTGTSGDVDGDVGTATMSYPYGMAFGADGNLYFTDFMANTVRKIQAQ